MLFRSLQEVASAFREALSRLDGLSNKPSSWKGILGLERVRDHVDRRFREALRIGVLARMAGVSVSTFARAFRRMTGKGLERYLQDRRMAEARRLLRTTNLPVSRIVRDCGFRSDSYFTRFFRKRAGKNPAVYRRESQREGGTNARGT